MYHRKDFSSQTGKNSTYEDFSQMSLLEYPAWRYKICLMIDTNYTAVGKFNKFIFFVLFFLIETVENKRFLHAEIHPINVMSDQIEKLHSHLLKTKMVRKIFQPTKFHILKLNSII